MANRRVDDLSLHPSHYPSVAPDRQLRRQYTVFKRNHLLLEKTMRLTIIIYLIGWCQNAMVWLQNQRFKLVEQQLDQLEKTLDEKGKK